MIQNVDPEVIATGVTLIIGLVDALRRYRKDETVKLSQLPLLEFRALARFFRKTFFTVDRPDHAGFVVDHSVASLTRVLGKQGVKPKHPFSYRYDGEVYNGLMYAFEPDAKYPHRQIHTRAFPHANGLEIMAHAEPHWYHHPVAHLRSKDMEHEPANEFVKQRLENQVPIGYPGN